ncbi:MAG: hypothetical protein JNG89_01860, partial [Planctomycetaceae bacterium]|nr:hypothetical protein [Planctomycetaceae bacterium]
MSLRSLPWMIVLCCTAPCSAAGITTDFLMDSDPEIRAPDPVVAFDPALKSLWMEALQRPEADMQRMAAETIARAHRLGVPDLAAAVPPLERIVEDRASHPAARYSAAHALIVLDSQGSAEKLLGAAETYGSDLRQLVEPALADWNYQPARDLWSKRLNEPLTRRRDLVLAIRGLGRVGETAALPQLLAIVDDTTRRPDLRLEAAAAAGRIADSGLDANAERLAQDTRSPPVSPLCAVRLLARHASDSARQMLLGLAGRPESAVAAAAMTRLNEIDPALVVPLAEAALRNADPHVRRQGATALLALPTAERIAPLAELLADAHPEIRREVCGKLYVLAEQPELSEAVRNAAMTVLAADRWQGQEQAALLLGALGHKPAAGRMVELLELPRPEQNITAAWALRKLAVPETVPAIVDKARRQTQIRMQARTDDIDVQVAHLFEALGAMGATEAEPLLLEYVPKQHETGIRSRAAAIWAIGRLREGMPDTELADALDGRINDFDDKFPDHTIVKQLCVVTLVRMGAVDRAPMFRDLALNVPVPIELDLTLRWAV